MTVSASIPVAVLGMLALKYFSRMSGTLNSILEANQIQTAASAGESLAAGIIANASININRRLAVI